jgi:hypothetical protein
MEMLLLKVDKVKRFKRHVEVEIPNGGIQLSDGLETVSLNEPLKLEMSKEGYIKNITRDIEFVVYFGSSIFPVGERTHSLINILANEKVLKKIYKKVGIK